MKEIIYDYLRKKLGNDVELEIEVIDFFSPTTKIVKIEINGYYYSLMVDENLDVFSFISILDDFYRQYLDSTKIEEDARELCTLLSNILNDEVTYEKERYLKYFYAKESDGVICQMNGVGLIEFLNGFSFTPETLIRIAEFYRDNY